MEIRILPKMVIPMITFFVLLPAVLSAILDKIDDNQPVPPGSLTKGASSLPVNYSGAKPSAPKLGPPEPPTRPDPKDFPINFQIKDKPSSPSKDAAGKLGFRDSKDLKTADSYGYYSYYDLPYYYCSFYWPYYCYGNGYGYKYLPLYTSYWGKWNEYYASPYYNYYDNYYDDFWYRR